MLNQRALAALRKKKIRQEFIPFWPHVKMLDSELSLLRYRMKIASSVPDYHYVVIEQVDLPKAWAQRFPRRRRGTDADGAW